MEGRSAQRIPKIALRAACRRSRVWLRSRAAQAAADGSGANGTRTLTDPLSLEDLFLVGVSLDLLVGYFLARGLLEDESTFELAMKPAADTRGSRAAVVIKGGVDTRIGLAILAVGFICQAAGYVLTLAGLQITTSAVRTILALALAVLAMVLIAWIAGRVTRWMRTEWAKAVISRMKYIDGMREDEVMGTMAELGLALGVGDALIDTAMNVAEVVEKIAADEDV